MAEKPLFHQIPYKPTPDDSLYFLHIGKTAGRSFEDYLKSHFTPDETLRINVPTGYPVKRASAAAADRNIRLYIGHLGYHFLSLFPEGRRPLWVTMLRDPIERVISHYYFLRNAKPIKERHFAYRIQEIAGTCTLLEFVESTETDQITTNNQFNNLVDSEFIYREQDKKKFKRSENSTVELVQLVKQRLENECLFLGITEQYDRSIKLLSYLLKWDPPAESQGKLNVTPRKPARDAIDPNVIEGIKQRVQLDIEIYEFALSLFEKRYEAIINQGSV